MKRSEKGFFSKILQSKQNRAIIIILEVAALLTLVVLTCAVLSGDLIKKNTEPTQYVPLYIESSTDVSSLYETQLAEGIVPTGNVSAGLPNNYTPTQNAGGYINNAGGNTFENEKTPTITLENPSGWSRAQILSKASDAVNKTKAYKNALTVHHKESFDAEVTEASGGAVVQSVANVMVGWVVQPVDETLNYQNGAAVNSEGETVPIILPKKNNFYLGESGVTSASAKVVNNEYVLNISLVEENVGMHEVPQHNAAAIGYLDVANFDLSFLTVDSANITYKGSSLELHINAQGYVTYAEYHIPLNIVGSGHSGSISGSVTFDGEQTEVWTLNY